MPKGLIGNEQVERRRQLHDIAATNQKAVLLVANDLGHPSCPGTHVGNAVRPCFQQD